MRLTHDQIRLGIIHPEQVVRDVALQYFSESFSDDLAVMPLAVQAVETHGWENAFRFSHRLADLPQTEETLLWVIDQLNRLGRPRAEQDVKRCAGLSRVLSSAEAALLMRHEEKIIALEGLDPAAREIVADRLQLLTLDTASLWSELEAFCQDNQANPYIDKVDLPHALRVAESIAADETSARRVLYLVTEKVDHSVSSPMSWMEGLAIHMAGLMKLEAAVPAMIAKLMADGEDFVNEECLYALPRIGTDAAVEALCRDFPAAPWHYRLFASGSLERIHTDLAIAKCRALLDREKDTSIRESLTGGVLWGFSPEGIELARQVPLSNRPELRRQLVGAALLTGVAFPRLEALHEAVKKADQESEDRRQWLLPEHGPAAPAPSFDHLLSPPPPSPLARTERAGRNDPCPCGSGKKFKKCCGKNQ